MNLVADQLRHSIRLLVAAVLLLIVPFVGMAPHPAVAMEDHAMATGQHTTAGTDCAAACAQAVTGLSQNALQNQKIHVPDPESQEIVPYHPQFQVLYTPQKLTPATGHDTMPSKPPDIVKLSGHFLF